MSNPVITPGVPPVVPPPRRRSLAGPFVLIILGAVFLMATMHLLSIGTLAHLFANYWPALLILWGVIKLVEHQRAQHEGYRASGIGGGGVVLVVMIVVFGLMATQLEHVNWSGLLISSTGTMAISATSSARASTITTTFSRTIQRAPA